MEKFKACEKEMKTKAFSKEGLIAATRLDPKEQEKEEEVSWLQSKVEELQIQVEQAEAEIESLQGTGKKRNKGSSSARTSELEELNERRKWHISRLELILRLLDNGTMSVERVNALKEDVSYFVESNTVRPSIIFRRIYMNCFMENRKKSLTRTRGSTMSLIWRKRRRSSALRMTITRVTIRKMQVKVSTIALIVLPFANAEQIFHLGHR